MPFILSEIDREVRQDIRDNIARAERFVGGLELKDFLTDDKTFYAATRCLEIISGASRRLLPELKQRYPEIRWKAIAGSGNIYRYNYEDVLERRVWDTIQVALLLLIAVVVVELTE
jgi:uncharacterized protein with HEPN domain